MLSIDEAIAFERQQAKDKRNEHYTFGIQKSKEATEEHEQLAEWLEELKALREHTTWIPCSERLPEEAFGCLVTVMDCEPSTQTDFENILPYFVGYDGETWNDADGNVIPFEVIAWQPLPEPYKESD